MGLNWGGFAGGFSQGFHNGVSIGKSIGAAVKEDKLNKIREAGIAEANALRDKEINDSVRENPIEGATQATQATTEAPQAAAVTTQPVDVPTSASISKPMAEDPMTADQPAPVKDVAATAAVPAPAPVREITTTPPAPAANPAAQGMPSARKRFEVGGKGFDTRDEALAHARKSAPSMMDYMTKTMVPKMQEELIAQGDIEKAEAWGKWAKDRKNQRTMEVWSKAYTAAQRGDMDGAANGVFELYKQYDDGVTPISKETVKDKDGNVTGFNVKLKDDATGEERSQFVGQQELLAMGMSALSPVALFEQAYKKQGEAEKMAAQNRMEIQKEARGEQRDMRKQEYIENRADRRELAKDKRETARAERNHGYELEKIVTREDLERNGYGMKERAKLKAEMDLARENGFDDEEIKAMVRHKVGGGYKKTTDPQERRALIVSDLTKNDLNFAKEPKPEQEAKVNRMMELIYGDEKKPAGGAGTVPNPFGQGAPQKAPAGVKDGKYMVDGQPVEVRGGMIIPLQKK